MTSQDDNKALPQGENLPQLQDADDLAIEALSQSSKKQIATSDIKNEEDNSDEFAQTLHSLENVIESKANKLMDLKQKMSEKNEMIKNVYENDVEYQEAEAIKQEATQAHKQRKNSLEESAQMKSLRDDIRSLKEDLKDIEESLSNHLINYHQLTNSTSFDTSDGDQWEFDIKAKVKNRKTK